MPTLSIQRLDNGVRVVTEHVEAAKSVSIQLYLAHGSRHESEGEGGLTHFGEHMIFKGTDSLTWKELARRLNMLGGQFNACTSTDWVKLYTHVIRKDVEETVGLMAGMFLQSAFPPEEALRERDVILEEIAMYEDNPEDQCFEKFTQALLLPHPVGRPVIGIEDFVSGYTRDELAHYWQKIVVPERLILSVAGGIREDEVLRLANRVFGGLEGEALPQNGMTPASGWPNRTLIDRDLEQINFCFGITGPKRCQDERFVWGIYDTILGGGMGSRLFDEVRESRGLAYSIGSAVSTFHEAGYLSISGSTRPDTAAEAVQICRDQIQLLADGDASDDEIATAKAQIERGHLLALESLNVRSTVNAERELYGVEHLSSEETLARLNAVTREEVTAIARQVAGFGLPAACFVGPLNKAVGLGDTFDGV